MKIGLQTIAWTHSNLSLEEIIAESQSLEFDGVEVFQRVSSDSLKSLGGYQRIFGFAGGSLQDRLRAAQSLQNMGRDDQTPVYVYVDSWNKEEDKLYRSLDSNVVIAVHPHMFKPVQTMHEALEKINTYPYTRLLLDTGHLAVAGIDPVNAIKSSLNSLVGVHLKDWTPEYGRSYPFYSSGFCSLGKGRVPIRGVVEFLIKANFKGYLIVEQDFTAEPFESMLSARKFLKNLGV